MWSDLLERNGLSVTVVDSTHVQVRRGSAIQTLRLVQSQRRLRPSEIGTPPEPSSLLVVPWMSPAAAAQARASRWSVIADEGPAWIVLGPQVIDLRRDEDAPGGPGAHTVRRGRPGFGIYAVLAALLALPDGATQRRLAERAHVSQPRVSQALNLLVLKHLVTHGDGGWRVPDPAAAVDWWVGDYPGPGGIRTHWFGLDPVVEQARHAYAQLADKRAEPVVSGDVAADLIAPWRVPQHALLYARTGTNLSQAGLTPATSQESSLTLIVPADPTVWPIGNRPHRIDAGGVGEVARASALQVLWDLRQSDGPDRDEAAAAWRTWMLSGGAIE